LLAALGEPDRAVAEPAEPDVDEPRLPVDVDAQREVVERRAEAVRGGGPGAEQGDLVPERGEQRTERAVELVAEAAPVPLDDLVDERLRRQIDRLLEMDAEVLER